MDNSKYAKRIFAWIPAAIWAFLILILSILPGKTLPETPIGYLDKAIHFFAYFLFSLLLVRGFNRSFSGPLPLKYILFILILTLGYGILMELIQFVVPGREPSALDVAANTAGVLFGITIRKWIL
jgi:VanZ family protein